MRSSSSTRLLLSDEELRDLMLGQVEQDTDGPATPAMPLLDVSSSSDDDLRSLGHAAQSDPIVPHLQHPNDDLFTREKAVPPADDLLWMSLLPRHDASAETTTLQRGEQATRRQRHVGTQPCAAKARLRTYERRSRHKREHRMRTMKQMVVDMERSMKTLCQGKQTTDDSLLHVLLDLMMEATSLAHHNKNLRKALEDHRFFHSMLQLEYDYRETPASSLAKEHCNLQCSWRPIEEAMCLRIMRDSFLEIVAFSNSEDFVSSNLEICGWREKRKLVGNSVNFVFHKQFAKNCSEDLATRSWEMRAVQDQVTRYFGHSLEVKVEVLQRFENNVVVVRRKIKHTVDEWEHHTIYLLFRTKTPDGHLVCIRDMNPEDTDDLHLMSGSATMVPSQCVIWSKAFIWWKFTTLPEAEGQQIRGFEVEYGGSLGSATQADAAFWIREVLVLALRWENLVIGPLVTLG